MNPTEAPRMLNGFPVEHKRLDELTKAPWNPRKISEEQRAALECSLAEFGTVEPIVVNRVTGHVVGGHQRLDALLALGETTTDVIVVELAAEREKLLNIALNRISGEWDEVKLTDLLNELTTSGLDTSLTGFSTAEIDELLQGSDFSFGVTEEPEIELNEEQAGHLNAAWQEWGNDTLFFIEELQKHNVISHNVTPTIARIMFLRALYFGKEYPRWCSHAFHPQQLFVAGHEHSMVWAIEQLTQDPRFAERFRWCLKEKPSIDVVLSQSPPLHAARLAADFPASLARDLINEFSPAGGAVLDPCHGWGGRMVGFLLSHAGKYVGFDPAEQTHLGTTRIFDDFSRYVNGKHAELYCRCFEDSTLEPESFDFALTSPPYFNVEKYEGAQTSFRKYGTFEKWDTGFFRPLIQLTYRALRNDTVFALQIGNQSYPLEERALVWARECGFEHIATRASGMTNSLVKTPEEDGEVIVLLHKPRTH